MNITTKIGNPFGVRADILTVFAFQGDRKLAWAGAAPPGDVRDVLKAPLNDFSGKVAETTVVYAPNGESAPRMLLVGLGKRRDFAAGALRTAVGAAALRGRAQSALAAKSGAAQAVSPMQQWASFIAKHKLAAERPAFLAAVAAFAKAGGDAKIAAELRAKALAGGR